MVEKKCRLIPQGSRLLARLFTRAFGRTEWIVVEEYDVTDDVREITRLASLVPSEMVSTEHRAPSTEHRAPSTEHRAPSTEHRARER